MLKNERHVLSNEDLNTVSQWLEGYSGSDIKLVCHEAAMLPVRELDISADLTTASVRPIALADFQNAIAAIKYEYYSYFTCNYVLILVSYYY